MPKKINWLDNYYIPSPERKLDPSLEKYCEIFGNRNLQFDRDKERLEEAAQWLLNNLDALAWEKEFWQKPAFYKCDEYFQKYEFARPAFKIFQVDVARLNFSEIKNYFYPIVSTPSIFRLLYWNLIPIPIFIDPDFEKINSALREETFLKLSFEVVPLVGYLYLCGKQLWTISEKESFLSDDELRLVFLETVDKERKKFEKLQRKFSGLAGEKIEEHRDVNGRDKMYQLWARKMYHLG